MGRIIASIIKENVNSEDASTVIAILKEKFAQAGITVTKLEYRDVE
jgi:hypothetical protein